MKRPKSLKAGMDFLGREKKPKNINKIGGTPPLLDRSRPVDVSRL